MLASIVLGACGGDDVVATTFTLPEAGDGLAVGPEAAPGAGRADLSSTTTAPATEDPTTTTTPPSAVGDATTTSAPGANDGTTTTTTAAAGSTTQPPPPPSSTTPPADESFILVGDDRYVLSPAECGVWDGEEALVTGTADAPDGSTVYFAIDVSGPVMGGVMIDLDSADPIKRTDNTLVSGFGATRDNHFDATITGTLVEITTTFVPGNGGDPLPGSVEVDCG